MKDLFSIDGKRLRLFDFREVLKVILVLSLFHALFLILDIPVDIAFAYCPVFYLYLASRENRQSVSWARIHSHLILLVALMCMTLLLNTIWSCS